MLLLDNPEEGLNPSILPLLAETIKGFKGQLIMATNSPLLLNEFEPEDIIVADFNEGGSNFKRINEEFLQPWIDEGYSLGDLWMKNLINGRNMTFR